MRGGNHELFTRAATAITEADGVRSGAEVVIKQVAAALSANVGFIALRRGDSAVADIIAGAGLGAADFRRLETRITRSSLWQIFTIASPIAIDDLGQDAALNFLAFGPGARMLIAVPVRLHGITLGMIAAGFPDRTQVDENAFINVLAVIAAMVAQAMRVESVIDQESRRIAEENRHLKLELKEKYDLSNLIGKSSQMRQVSDRVTQIARSNAAVLLRGESGTGKELVANAIHYNSLRSKRPLVKLACSAVPENLIESELFGCEKGAFPGAATNKKGRFEMADGGTLFLDEICDLPPQTQVKLLRVMRESEFERLGGTETVRVNVRLIAATNKDLEEAIAEGEFREDLFYRLNVFTIYMPPLRERKADILLLAEHFLERFDREYKKNVKRISTPAIDMLTAYHFPGNVRELENAIERAVLACDSNVIHGHHLPPTLQTAEVSGTETCVTLASAVEAFERDMIIDALKSTRGNVARATIMLDSTERILGYKIKKYAINPRRFKD
jgi:Nif-specific regulatory protein